MRLRNQVLILKVDKAKNTFKNTEIRENLRKSLKNKIQKCVGKN